MCGMSVPKTIVMDSGCKRHLASVKNIIAGGQSLRDGPISKTGRPQLRSTLIQAAWVWIIKDTQARQVYLRITRNTGQKNKAITAMARRLAIHLWKMLCNNEPYRKAV